MKIIRGGSWRGFWLKYGLSFLNWWVREVADFVTTEIECFFVQIIFDFNWWLTFNPLKLTFLWFWFWSWPPWILYNSRFGVNRLFPLANLLILLGLFFNRQFSTNKILLWEIVWIGAIGSFYEMILPWNMRIRLIFATNEWVNGAMSISLRVFGGVLFTREGEGNLVSWVLEETGVGVLGLRVNAINKKRRAYILKRFRTTNLWPFVVILIDVLSPLWHPIHPIPIIPCTLPLLLTTKYLPPAPEYLSHQ